jgi:hypothetical protein
MMISPYSFGFNDVFHHFNFKIQQTSDSNSFQHEPVRTRKVLKEHSMNEFNESVQLLKNEGINVIVLDKPTEDFGDQPDAVFCNNWISTTPTGTIVLYSMCTENRNTESKRFPELKQKLVEQNFHFEDIHDFTEDKEILEGTGSMVFDHINKKIYAALSNRTEAKQIEKLVKNVKYYSDFEPILFQTKTSLGDDFYHTNVVMSIGKKFVVICSECIIEEHRSMVMKKLQESGKTIVDITLDQTEKNFCGNMIEIGDDSNPLIVMSDSAYKGFTKEQMEVFEKNGKIIVFPISKTIEFIGGGSARCMIGEIFLPKKK